MATPTVSTIADAHHLRVGDTKGISSPAVPLMLSIAALVLRLLSA